MIGILITLVAVVAALTYFWLDNHYSYFAKQNVLHEKPVFFLGNMKGLGRLYHWIDINRRRYNLFKGKAPFAGCYIFLKKSYFLLDLDLIKQVMVQNFSSFPNRGLYHNVADDPLTGSLLFLDGESWRVLRHKLSGVFTSGKIKQMFPTMVKVGYQLVEAGEKLVANGVNQVEVKNLCALYTTDVIGTCAFGLQCNSLNDPNAEFRQMGRKVFEQPRHHIFIQTFMFTSPEWAMKFHLKNFRDDVSEFFIEAVKETVEYRQRNKIRRNDFMDLLIELKEQRDQADPSSDENDLNNGLTLIQIAAQAMTFFLAGFDTSSTTMAFCLYELALNPEVQEKLREEIQLVLDNHSHILSYEAIKEMVYLEQVIAETLRKHSVTPHIVRVSTTPFQVPNTTHTWAPKSRIIIPVDAIHHDPEYYPNPEVFDPSRFTQEEIQKRHPCAYLPFGDGPRNCIGARFGKLQAKIGITLLLKSFRFSPNAATEVPIRISKKSFLVNPESGINLNIEKIK